MSQFITVLIKKNICFARLKELSKNNHFQLQFTKVFSFEGNLFTDEMHGYVVEWQEDKFGFNMEETNSDLLLEKDLFKKIGACKAWDKYRHTMEKEKYDDKMKKQVDLENFLRALLQQHPGETVGFFIHWYESKFDKENIEFKKTVMCTCEDGKAKLPNRMENDVLYCFQCQAH